MSKEKFVVWSNLDLDLDDWRADLEDEYPGLNDDELIEKMNEINDSYDLIGSGAFKCAKVGRKYLIPKIEIIKFLYKDSISAGGGARA